MKDCWIDPKGKIHEVPDFGHNDFAFKLMTEEIGHNDALDYLHENNTYPFEWLHEKGWVRLKYNNSYLPKVQILGGCIDLTKPQRNTIDPAMNRAQMKVAKLICEEAGEDFHRAINDKRFW